MFSSLTRSVCAAQPPVTGMAHRTSPAGQRDLRFLSAGKWINPYRWRFPLRRLLQGRKGSTRPGHPVGSLPGIDLLVRAAGSDEQGREAGYEDGGGGASRGQSAVVIELRDSLVGYQRSSRRCGSLLVSSATPTTLFLVSRLHCSPWRPGRCPLQ